MAMKPYDIADKVKVAIALLAQSITADAEGSIVDTNGYDSVGLVVVQHTITTADADNTLEVIWQESDNADLSGAAAVSAANMVAIQGDMTNPIVATDEDATVYTWQYHGSKRYLRCDVNITGTVEGIISAYVILGNSKKYPIS